MTARIIKKIKPEHLLSLAWALAIFSVIGSLIFSEVFKFLPCDLCWYQRVLMIGLALVLGVGVWLKDKKASIYGLSLSITGLLVAIWHNLIQYGVIEQAPNCNPVVPCDTLYINWFGFVTIPLLSLLAYTTISGLLIWHRHLVNKK